MSKQLTSGIKYQQMACAPNYDSDLSLGPIWSGWEPPENILSLISIEQGLW